MNEYQDDMVADFYKFRPPYHPNFIAQLVKEVNLQRTDVPLDLLCGRGEIAKHLSKYCDSVVAVDGSRQMLNRSEPADNIKYLLGDVNHVNFIDLFEDKKFSHCFVGRAIHWIKDNSLVEIEKSIFCRPTWFVTMQGGYSKDNPWLQSYNEVIRSYISLSNGVDWISKEKVISAGFSYKKSLSSVFSMKINIDFLYGTALSYSNRAHVLKYFETEIKSSLGVALKSHLQDDGFLMAKISNSGFIYRS